MDLATTLVEQATTYSLPEAIAVAAATAYLLLAIRQNIWCWVFAAISTTIYIYLYIVARLYMESVLNVFYLAMAVYGWWVWYFGDGENAELAVSTRPLAHHARAVLAIVVLAATNGYFLEAFTDAKYPYADSATTWGAIWATYLVAQKVLENWWYWLLIDAASVAMNWLRGLELTAMLFVLYLLLIPFGYLSWRRSMARTL